MYKLKLDNFRSFRNIEFDFSKINILIGENSAGKSSLLKFLLANKQTIDSSNEINFKLKGDLVDLGNYEEMIFNKETDRDLSFTYSIKDDYFNYFRRHIKHFIYKEEIYKKDVLEYVDLIKHGETFFSVTMNKHLNDLSSIDINILNNVLGEINLTNFRKEEFSGETICDIEINFNDFKGFLKEVAISRTGFFTLVRDLKSKIKETYPDAFTYLFSYLAYLLMIQNYLLSEIYKIRYVNPVIGKKPNRFYFQEDRLSTYNITDIRKFINVMGDPYIDDSEYQEKMKLLNDILKKFGIVEEVKLTKNEEMSIVRIDVKTKGYWSNLTDVGYGVSLQIPIFFQAIMSENFSDSGHTLLIEQPEIHLHPYLQSKFIESLLSIGRKNNYFIETHSEHIIRKLQVLIKNKEFGLSKDDVRIYYFSREENIFNISEHKILENGKLEPIFPSGFYDNSYNLSKELF